MIQGMPAEFSLPGLVAVEHTFEVPLDHDRPDGASITVFARELAAHDGRERPFLVYFQGGPGFEAVRPSTAPVGPGWLKRALADFRVLMLDQRGTGRSTPVGELAGLTPEQQADYLTHFRADSIVSDAEWIRRELGVERWSVLGQSFGGFCVMAYLSIAPDGLREALITGGVPPLGRHVDEIYAKTYKRVLTRNRRYLERYGEDRGRLVGLRRRLDEEPLRLPSGDPLTWRRFRQVGRSLGMSDGAETVHHLVELPPDSPAFRHDAEAETGFARNPIYAILHEASWADGFATRWSADRVLPEQFRDAELLTGEHVYPWMFEDYGALASLSGAADLLAAHEWPQLYDAEVLRGNRVPTAAAIYAEDMYVEREFSEETIAQIGSARAWVTSEYDHNGLRADGERILGYLLDLTRGER
jgi:pimeloyl-ACP methyl ester carboxylesterase